MTSTTESALVNALEDISINPTVDADTCRDAVGSCKLEARKSFSRQSVHVYQCRLSCRGERWFPNQLPDSGNEYSVRAPPKPPLHPVKRIEITKVNSSCALECIRDDPAQPEPEENEPINGGNDLPAQPPQQPPPSGALDQRDDENYLMNNFLKKHLLKEQDKLRNKPQAQEVPYFSPNSESKFREDHKQAPPQQSRRWSDPPRAKPQSQQRAPEIASQRAPEMQDIAPQQAPEIAPQPAPEVQEKDEPEADLIPSLLKPSRVYNRSCAEFKLTLQNILRDLGVICQNGTKLLGTANGSSKMNLFVHLPFPACKVVNKREVGGARLTHRGRLNVVYRLVPSSCRKQRSSLLFGVPGQRQNGTENNSYNVQIFVLNKKMTAPLIIQLKDIQDFVLYSAKTKNCKGEKAKKKAKTKSAEAGSSSSTKTAVASGVKNKRNTVFMRYLERGNGGSGSTVRNGLDAARTVTNLTLNETEINSILESMGRLYPSSNYLKFPTKNLTDPRIWSQIQNETDKFAWGHQI